MLAKRTVNMLDTLPLWDIAKSIVSWALLPLVGGMTYFIRKNFERLDKMELELQDQKTKTAVIESKVDDIRDDIKDIKRNVEKLVDRN